MIVNDPSFFSVSSIEPDAYCIPHRRSHRKAKRRTRKNQAQINSMVLAFLIVSIVTVFAALIRRVIEDDSSYSVCKYLKRLMHLRYLQCLQGEDASASSSLGIIA
ncbi:hypothetical protein HGO34_18735 [Agrobacterium vitis]|uniref:Uncharacterized protein n=2 Tax=Agrobacterium vitis TaxID=373 RepID=A0AAE4WFL8_AGRVI|nr:hypothetical protein [Agrobacterium vitis]MCF1500172.1 hypothetical protein [Allorhizobium sp. Av2]MCM2441766.1 hypothetical protein [Agrobacterium vitis]MUZ59013.1 hypothetical protein [Agrobacterium vitis]